MEQIFQGHFGQQLPKLLAAWKPKQMQRAGVGFVARSKAHQATLEHARPIDSLYHLEQGDLLSSFGQANTSTWAA